VCRLTDADDPFPVVGFSPEAGDRHADGDAVTVIDFGDERAVYKPRSVAASRSLSRVFDRLAEVSSLSVPSPPTVVTRDGYGWAAHVDCDSFDARSQLSAYYDRAGVVAWLATLLGATDLHHENLVATAAGPVIVDAETAVGVFDPTDARSADDRIRSRTLARSVFGTRSSPRVSRRHGRICRGSVPPSQHSWAGGSYAGRIQGQTRSTSGTSGQ